MSTNRKARSDSKLKTLPEERQAAIAEHARDHTLYETVKWLRADGIVTSIAALSVFLSWYCLQQKLARNDATVELLLEEAKKTNPNISAAKIQEMGQAFFSALALSEQDPDSWVNVQTLGLSERSAQFKAQIETAKLELRKQAEARAGEKLKLELEKFKRDTCDLFLKWHEDKQAREIASSSATNADKIERLGQLMFGEDWKPEKS